MLVTGSRRFWVSCTSAYARDHQVLQLTMTVNTAWDRELVSFMLVDATVRAYESAVRL
jgi:hypothetical protein